jgi:L-asparaginase II
MRIQLDVLVWRGTIAESHHRVQAVACTPAAEVALETDAAATVTSFRSSAKPFQCLPLVERGHADRWGFSDEQLAVMCASHTGSEYHVRLVTGILERIGLGAEDLACGYHPPLDPVSRAALEREPERRSKLYNNCSGKHAGMLCLARSEGWPVAGYATADHPLQRLMKDTVAEMAGVPAATLSTGVDGCGAVTFGLPIAAMARAFARLGTARSGGDAREAALARIRSAMVRYPLTVSGAGELTARLMQIGGGRIVAKGGAEGLQCLALPERRLGLVLKAEDGAARAMGPAVAAVLDLLDVLDGEARAAMEEFRRPVVRNCAGDEVGSLEATIRQLAPAHAPGGA